MSVLISLLVTTIYTIYFIIYNYIAINDIIILLLLCSIYCNVSSIHSRV